MRRAWLLVGCLLFAGSLLGCGDSSDHVDSFAARLTVGSWSKTIGSAPAEERYIYQFNDDGTYERALFTDTVPPPREVGRWTIGTDSDGRTHLMLQPDDASA